MPKCAHYTFDGGGLAIWHITESSDELYALLDTRCYDAQLAELTSESRRAEWLAVRLLVFHLFGSDCEIAYHSTGRPYLRGSSLSVSISHTKGYAAIAYSSIGAIGMDIEYVSSRVERIAHRFTSSEEAAYIDGHAAVERQMYHLINWSAKETLYKLCDSPHMAEFKSAFFIAPYDLKQQGVVSATISRIEPSLVEVHYRLQPELVCTWALDASGAISPTR